jgi:hypothetical protein
MRTESYGDPAMEALAAARDSDELCRLLVQSPWGWGSSTRHGEAVSLLCGLRGGTLPGSLVALLLCTCRRWDRVTAKLIAAVEECGVLSGPDLDELAESLLGDEVVAVFPLAWISRRWLELGTADGTTRTVQVSDEAVARDERRVEPPLRRWAACWWAGRCAAESPGSAGPLWTGCVSSTGRERRCATPGRTLTGRCALGARPARLHRRRRSCRALHHRPREGARPCAGWLVVMCGAAVLLAAKLRRPCNGCRPGGTRMRLSGRWRITEAELWDRDALNLVAPAFIEFAKDGSGSFGFIAVQGEMDCREVERDRRPGVEFSWEGNDECDPASGRGWAVLEEDGSLSGRIFFHLGDDSGFTAVREAAEGRF